MKYLYFLLPADWGDIHLFTMFDGGLEKFLHRLKKFNLKTDKVKFFEHTLQCLLRFTGETNFSLSCLTGELDIGGSSVLQDTFRPS